MARDDSAIEAAACAVTDARDRDDRAGEARALSTLGQALLNAHRVGEGRYICRQAEQLAVEVGDRDSDDQVLTVLGLNPKELDELASQDGSWRDFLLDSSEETQWFASFQDARSDEYYKSGFRSNVSYRADLFVELAVGFVTVKFLGPFAEAFATKLGESLGESAARAIGRIRLLRNHRHARTDLDVVLPESTRTTLVLPADFTDAARLAAIDLDLTAEDVRGAELHWDVGAGRWRSVKYALFRDGRALWAGSKAGNLAII
ncbi:hypothetical protein [Actinoallomurus bryophytorum]|nr:hypothetical protein [Actinoallomurus bryophytorum]